MTEEAMLAYHDAADAAEPRCPDGPPGWRDSASVLNLMPGDRQHTSDAHVTVARLFAEHHKNLRTFIVRRIGNVDDANDIVQNAFLEAYRCMDRFKGQSNVKTWLYGITLNIMRNYVGRSRLRYHESIDDYDSDDFGDACPSASDIFEDREQCRRVADALDQVPADHRESLLLVAIDGLSYEEAAARLNVAVGTVRSRVSRLRAHLREACQ